MGMNKKLKIKGFLFLLVILIFIVYGLIYVDRVVQPTLAELGETAARGMITELTSEAIKSAFNSEEEIEHVLDIRTDESGKVTMVSTNGIAITRMASFLGGQMQEKMKMLEPMKVKIPLGAIFASPVLSETGPSVKVKVEPMGVAKVTAKTVFEEKGINQTKYKVYVQVGTTARVLAPFSKNEISVNNAYLIAEVVIVGDVPESYIITPKDGMLDALSID